MRLLVHRSVRLASSIAAKPTGKYDAVIVGGGHNGLISACYLAEKKLRVAVLERRHVLGGAAVTEEIVPGWKFSRCSYVLSLLRPHIMKHLDLKSHGLKLHLRDPNSYTPALPQYWKGEAKSLLLGRDGEANKRQIGQFSARDAAAFDEYEAWLDAMVKCIDPLLDEGAFNASDLLKRPFKTVRNQYGELSAFNKMLKNKKMNFDSFYDILTSPISKILDQWFEGDLLRATLGTDGMIGACLSPHHPGSGYVLLHHVMGEQEGVAGAWCYPEGGMGAVSEAIASAARQRGVEIFTECEVSKINIANGKVAGVSTACGESINSDMVLSNATPKVTYEALCDAADLPNEFLNRIKSINYDSPVTKINVALKKVPNFEADPNSGEHTVMPWHRCTIHLNCENLDILHDSYVSGQGGCYSKRPMIELTLPSSLDRTIVPDDESHVALLFTQFTPFELRDGPWTEESREAYARTVFGIVDEYAPGFSSSIVGYEVLTPDVLESTFGLTGGNIFHGAMGLDQLYFARPSAKSPVSGLFLCGSGTHPGGGVMGSPGYIAAKNALKSKRIKL